MVNNCLIVTPVPVRLTVPSLRPQMRASMPKCTGPGHLQSATADRPDDIPMDATVTSFNHDYG